MTPTITFENQTNINLKVVDDVGNEHTIPPAASITLSNTAKYTVSIIDIAAPLVDVYFNRGGPTDVVMTVV